MKKSTTIAIFLFIGSLLLFFLSLFVFSSVKATGSTSEHCDTISWIDTRVVSFMDERDFQCVGSCFCDETDRRSVGVLRSGMFYAVAAVSSVVALHKAQSHFSEQCANEFDTDTCGVDNIKSEVSQCSELTGAEKEKYINTLEVDKKDVVANPKDFYCKGGCRGREDGISHPDIKCEDIRQTESRFTFDCPDVKQAKVCKRGNCAFARKDFRERFLGSHCERESTIVDENGNKESYCVPDKKTIHCNKLDGLSKFE